jgi:hypothetical protein
MEIAVLQERFLLTSEVKRLTRQHGPESTTCKTVENMLDILEQAAIRLQLKAWMDISSDEINKCQSIVETYAAKQKSVPPSPEKPGKLETEDEVIVVSGELTSVISGLTSKQPTMQRESLLLLADGLTNGL